MPSNLTANISAPITRRAFVQNSTLFLLGTGTCRSNTNIASFSDLLDVERKSKLKMGLVTDLHYADKDSVGTRHYRDSLAKLAQAAQQYQLDQPDLIVQLGDLIDAADSVEVEQRYLARIHKAFSALPGKKHNVLGNHCVYSLTKAEFLAVVEQEKSYYSFDAGGFHFVILDACFREDGQPYGRKNFDWTDANIPAEQLEWLAADLKATKSKTIILTHQRLDVSDNHSVKNASDVRRVLEESEKVMAVFQGHSHQNSYQEIAGIHYCVLAAMIEGPGPEQNCFSVLDILPDDTLQVTGFHQQSNYRW